MPLKVSDGIGAWIKDFKKSDAPQFKGKSEKERRDQAVAAYLSAKRGDKTEDAFTKKAVETGKVKTGASKGRMAAMQKQDDNRPTLRKNKANEEFTFKVDVELDESKKMKRMSLKQIEKEMDELDKAMGKMGRGGYAYDSMMDAWDDLNDMKKKLKKEAADDDTVRMIKANPKMKAKILRGLTPKARREIEKALKEDVELEENKARQSADLAKAMAAFKKRGGKIKRVAPGKAAGYHGKDDPGAGVHGMMDRPDTKGMPRKKVKSLRAGVEESVNEEMMFKVSVEGLPPMIMLGRSPGDIKGQLRKIVKQPSMITDVERMTKADVRKRYRDMAKGDSDEEA